MQLEVKEWLDFAKMDLSSAQHLYKTFYPRPLQIICYHCQQAAEKALKAVMLLKGSLVVCLKCMILSFC